MTGRHRQFGLAYLISQYPAINHGYLLREVRLLRALGIDVEVASISAPDRPPDRLSVEEREEAERVFDIEAAGLAELGRALLALLLRPASAIRQCPFCTRGRSVAAAGGCIIWGISPRPHC